MSYEAMISVYRNFVQITVEQAALATFTELNRPMTDRLETSRLIATHPAYLDSVCIESRSASFRFALMQPADALQLNIVRSKASTFPPAE